MHIMPFGKHRDRPLAAVVALDPNYCTWLDAQPWFAAEFPILRQALQLLITGDYTAAAQLPPTLPRRRRSRRDPPAASDIAAAVALYAPSEEIDGGCRVYRPLAFAARQ